MTLSSFTVLSRTLSLAFIFPAFCLVGNNVYAEHDHKPANFIEETHPLTGKIWDVTGQQYIARDQLLQKALSSDYVMLGETHDNIKHHEGQAWFISQLSQKKPGISVAFEMINQEQADAVNNTQDLTTGKLVDILEQTQSGWEFRKYYQPVFDSIVNAKLKIYAADLDRSTMMNVVSKGEQHIPDNLKKLIENTPLPVDQQEALKLEIESTHCGLINERMTRAMMTGQRVRDAAIGTNLYAIKSSDTRAVVLIAGSGHIRKDRGAPMYLHAQDRDASILTIAWQEVQAGVLDPKGYTRRWSEGELPFHYVIFTPAMDRPDPCEQMKNHMDQKKFHGKKTGE